MDAYKSTLLDADLIADHAQRSSTIGGPMPNDIIQKIADFTPQDGEWLELNEPVPKPMRLPTSDEVDTAQQQLGVTFHPDYRKYLLEASDVVFGVKEPCTVAPDGEQTDIIEVAKGAWDQMSVPCNLIPICEDKGFWRKLLLGFGRHSSTRTGCRF